MSLHKNLATDLALFFDEATTLTHQLKLIYYHPDVSLSFFFVNHVYKIHHQLRKRTMWFWNMTDWGPKMFTDIPFPYATGSQGFVYHTGYIGEPPVLFYCGYGFSSVAMSFFYLHREQGHGGTHWTSPLLQVPESGSKHAPHFFHISTS